MKRILRWLGLVLLLVVSSAAIAAGSVWGYYRSIVSATPGGLETGMKPASLGAQVNSFAGTGGYPWVCGHDTPAATLPFGMVRLGPDTASLLLDKRGFNRSGYFYGDNKIIGFSHTRLVGADAQEGGLFRVFPTTSARAAKDRSKDRFERFSHREETAFPGYYAVRLPGSGVMAELTATPRVGVHRYTFPKGQEGHILLDVTSALGTKRCENGLVRVLPGASEIEGSTRLFGTFSSRYGGLDAYFVARFSRPFAGFATWSGAARSEKTEASGDDAGAEVRFDRSSPEPVVELRVGLSYVSVANARLNLDTEAGSRGFDEIASAATEEWEKRLGVVRVKGGTESDRRVFYTRLYNSFLMPTVFNDVNGEYMGFDRAVHKAEGFRYFTDMSLWDTFRTAHPLYNLIARTDQRDMMVSLVEMAKAGGGLPRWPSGCGYTGSMLGTPADMAVTEAYLKGIRDFDIHAAYAAMLKTANESRPEGTRFDQRDGVEAYVEKGYCPSDLMEESVSSTLEYAHADHSIGLLAKALGNEEDAALYGKRARNYLNVWNPEALYFEERDSAGRFPKERDPLVLSYADTDGRYTRGYVEGSGLQWRWYVPYDADGLVALFPNRETFVNELEGFFANSTPTMGYWHPGAYYWHGNQPDIHAAYLFNAAGRPDLTQKWVRWVLKNRYADNYVGVDGNDDGGTLSAWYVFSALGFYPVAGTSRYELGSPLFESAEVDMGGQALSIETENAGAERVYVREVWLNGKKLDRTWFDHSEIAGGGTLKFVMQTGPAE